MRFLEGTPPSFELTYADVFLVPSFSDIASRSQVDLTTPDGIGTTIPVVVANMTAVSGRRMAETVARRGGMAIFPQDTPPGAIADMTDAVKQSHPMLETPVTLGGSDTVNTAIDLVTKRSHGAVVVVDDDRRPVGIFTESDAIGVDRFTEVGAVMSTVPIVLEQCDDPVRLFDRLTELRIHFAPVVDQAGRLAGAITDRGALRATVYRPALDGHGRLSVGAAIGVNGDVAAKAGELVAAGVDVLVVDTAHGHQAKMRKALESVRSVAPDVVVVAGNVVTGAGVADLVGAGADIVKVGVGPGAMCTTRMMTGVGRPQFSAVLECADAARQVGAHVWADGGVRHPRDVALALAAGASNVMIGSWFAGTFESAADGERDADGRLYKENYGMASKRAVTGRSGSDSALERARKEMFEEGISSSRMYLDPVRPSVEDLIDHVVTGVRSAFTYAGASTVEEFHDRAVVGVQTTTGYAEGMPLGESW